MHYDEKTGAPIVDMRELRALEIAARCKIERTRNGYSVPAQSKTGCYRVTLRPEVSCECDNFALTRNACKHVLACRILEGREGVAPAPKMDTSAVPKRKTYAQPSWPAYSQAQQQEKDRLQVLLADLCGGFAEPAQHLGRRRVPLADRLFSMCFKVWSTLSSRRFNCDLEDAHERGHLSRALHPNKVNTFMDDAELAPCLRAMIARSALPLKAVETTFAVDSSGFSTNKFVRWYDEKYGVERSGHDWCKVHIAVGTKTQVITAAAIYDRDAADSPILPELIRKTHEAFKVEEVSADKGYLSVENVETVFAAGGVAFIAPKVNTTGAAGGLFERMYHYYLYRRDDFLAHYHKRSIVESVFSAIKRKTGDAVRSRNPAAMVNESYCKMICHNLWCLILSHFELGIETEFWRDGPADNPADPPALLPFARPC
jgi:transposase